MNEEEENTSEERSQHTGERQNICLQQIYFLEEN
jgi:hypothetical protein